MIAFDIHSAHFVELKTYYKRVEAESEEALAAIREKTGWLGGVNN